MCTPKQHRRKNKCATQATVNVVRRHAVQGAALQSRLDPRVPDLAGRHAELNTLRWPSSEPDNTPARRSGDAIGKPCDDERYGDKIILFETTRLVNRKEE
jgi:hypothetical protein